MKKSLKIIFIVLTVMFVLAWIFAFTSKFLPDSLHDSKLVLIFAILLQGSLIVYPFYFVFYLLYLGKRKENMMVKSQQKTRPDFFRSTIIDGLLFAILTVLSLIFINWFGLKIGYYHSNEPGWGFGFAIMILPILTIIAVVILHTILFRFLTAKKIFFIEIIIFIILNIISVGYMTRRNANRLNSWEAEFFDDWRWAEFTASKDSQYYREKCEHESRRLAWMACIYKYATTEMSLDTCLSQSKYYDDNPDEKSSDFCNYAFGQSQYHKTNNMEEAMQVCSGAEDANFCYAEQIMKNITNQNFIDELCKKMPDLPIDNLTQQGDDINKYISKRFKYYKYKGALIVCEK